MYAQFSHYRYAHTLFDTMIISNMLNASLIFCDNYCFAVTVQTLSFFNFKCPELVVICVRQLFITKYDTACQNTGRVMNTVINSFISNVLAVPTERALLV